MRNLISVKKQVITVLVNVLGDNYKYIVSDRINVFTLLEDLFSRLSKFYYTQL